MINTYNQHGWVHLHNVISSDVVYELRTRAIEWRNWVKDKINQPCEYGPNYHWNGLGCAGMYDSYLMDFYTSDIMYDVSSAIFYIGARRVTFWLLVNFCIVFLH